MKVRYIKKGEYQGSEMTIGKAYVVIGIESDFYRIISDSNAPYLYNQTQFELIDNKEPEFWVTSYGESEERYSYPESWSRIGFFEDYHEGINSVIEQFWKECQELYAIEKSV